ncbi:putative DCC family thiol-disulfide oxidoreductase YuxK [Halospina denitrificans]|uniref:Putative DCC family thiol-disulfide oxidoreductase YuxK n=1 Tax=Halospina denitrificans TaxID=332522 RepID=A0A4R7JT99_9GAMM|nr:DCC1-like thiol-disulfide oxidoreductase family protein [Halospina denitrificans]TDT41490.1 putative DCC family thiol-disulfide oxidoreductase YuxK [Halospina denitrificans]
MDTLFYDGQCPLCNREMGYLRKAADNGLVLQDIHELVDPHVWPGVTQEQLLRRLHLLRESGDFEIGLEANVRAWSHTRIGWLLRPLLWPGIRRVIGVFYTRWADRRYCNRYACGLDR